MTSQRIAKQIFSSNRLKRKFKVKTLRTRVILKIDSITFEFSQVEAKEIVKLLTKSINIQVTKKLSTHNLVEGSCLKTGKENFLIGYKSLSEAEKLLEA
jgi:hypothetical protein